METSVGRTLELEAVLLGKLLREGPTWPTTEHRVRSQDFLGEAHGLVYQAVEAVANESTSVDMFTVDAELRRRGQAEAVGGVECLQGLLAQGNRLGDVSALVEEVLDQSLKRELLRACEEIATAALNAKDHPATKILDEAETRLFRIADRVSPEVQSVGVLAADLLDLAQRRNDTRGLSTGMASLDGALGPMLPGSLLVLGARPLAGQMALALGIAQHVALRERKAVAVFSRHQAAEALTERLVGIAARIDQRRSRQGTLTGEEINRLSGTVESLRDANLHVIAMPDLTLLQVRTTARKLSQASGGLGLVIIDDLPATGDQDMGPNPLEVTMAERAQKLHLLAKELGCVVLLLSDLTVDSAQDTDTRPRLGDLPGWRGIAEAAHAILLLHLSAHAAEGPGGQIPAEVTVVDSIDEPARVARLRLREHQVRFEDFADDTGR